MTLPEVPFVKDLGIYIKGDLKWDVHISKIKIKANQRAYLILKSFQTKDVWLLLKAYLTFVRPITEYGCVVWNPYLQKDIASIEAVQRSFTKKLCNRCNIPYTSYEHRLNMLNIRSLEYRRLETDLIMTYKILHKLIDIPIHDFFTMYSSQYNTRRHRFCLQAKRVCSNFQQNSFKNRVVSIWNKLPDKIVEAKTLPIFKQELKKIDLNQISELMY